MKMAEKSTILTFQNNCESINSNCVEVINEVEEKITNNDIKEIVINTSKQEDEPNDSLLDLNNMTQEDAVEKFLAGENKNDFGDDLLLETIEAENEGIEFKNENIILDCPDLDKGDFFSREEQEDDVDGVEDKIETLSTTNSAEDCLEVENSDCLTKMQIMEDVREGCSVQPSSPGHAEERLTNTETSKADSDENGFDEINPVNGDHIEENIKSENCEEVKKEKETDNIEKIESTPDINHVNEESSSNTSSEESQSNKRKFDTQESQSKKLRMEIQENFISRDKILNDFIEMAECNTIEQLQVQTEQILAEIKTLNELAREKEREWNNIIHLKKIKEELLLRMQRRKQVMLLSSDKNENGEVLGGESQTDSLSERLKSSTNQSILKSNLTHPNRLKLTGSDKNKFRNILPKPQQYSQEMYGSLDYRQNKQRQVVDVQSIIADYRQRHPETVPRRGRRIRNSQGENKTNNNVYNFSSLALGAGAQVQHNMQGLDVSSELSLLLNAMEANRTESRPSSTESSTTHGNEPSFKDMLVQFAKLSQSERHELIQNAIKPPPPYPEVTVHPVPTTTSVTPTNSLLHGILTKSPSSKPNSKTSFSPTLARLLTAPERNNSHSPSAATISNTMNNSVNMSISEILSTSKARNEITITPVGGQVDIHKGKSHALEEEEAEDSADRLVIDETNEDGRGRGDNSSDAGDEVPQCQGCNQKSALFVCAGCGNQWYCSRECQVSAWDEHSEVCSG